MTFYQHKTAFVTGGSTGIGLAIAKALAKEGSHVSIFARTVSKLETAAAEVKQTANNSAQKINFYSVDTSDNLDVQKIFTKAIEENGVPDILNNCGGIAEPD